MHRLIICFSLILAGCGPSGGGSASQSASFQKDLFSQWHGEQGETLNLTGAQFDQTWVVAIGTAAGGCQCHVKAEGTEASGYATLQSCTPYGNGTCSFSSETVSYTNSNGLLYLCYSASQTCESFH